MMLSSSDNGTSRVPGIVATVLFHVGLVLVCLVVWLRYPRPGVPEEPEKENAEITFEEVVELITGGTYVEAEFVAPEPEPQLSSGANIESAPPPPPEPTQEEIQQRKREQISKRVTFNTSTRSGDEGDGGRSDATVAASQTAAPEVVGLEGYSLGYFEQPHGTGVGIITIRIVIDEEGHVISADYYGPGSTYDVIKDPKARRSCIDTALKSKFNLKPGATAARATGYIKYKF